jgi:uncharacterized protein (DUF2235 family)
VSKSLVVCCDGTWDIADQLAPTNVTKISLGVAPKGPEGHEQRTYYHRGVGTGRFDRIRGGLFGFGFSHNVLDAYRFLVQNFDPGDQIYFFGFSRGAYTARSTAGLVRNAGIVRRENADKVDEAFRLYRDRRNDTQPRGIEATLFRRSYSHETRIRFIGVWDTVGALGIPLSGFRFLNVFNRRWQFHDTSLSTRVDAAFQALAIDENRGPYRPTLWTPQPDAPPGQRVEQVWFPGVHDDVGGGYVDHGLSDIPLLWMVRRAQELGLAFADEAFREGSAQSALPSDDTLLAHTNVDPDPFASMHESRVGLYRLLPTYLRRLGVTDAAHEYASSTAIERHTVTSYAPSGLVEYLEGPHKIRTVSVEAERRIGTPTRG